MEKAVRLLPLSLLIVTFVLSSRWALADGSSDAYSHFQRAVTLYSESDFTAALVEFKRAYTLAPASSPGTVNVLYNIGQTQFQLQKYAAALATFEKYVSEGGAVHNAEAESAIATLRDRVGRVEVTTNVPADIQIDDEPAGKTPLAAPLTASIGRRKITATAEGTLPVTAWVEVPSGEAVAVTLKLNAMAVRAAEAHPVEENLAEPRLSSSSHRTAAIVGWVTTGVLGAGAAITGIFALQSSKNLMNARDAFPADKDTVHSEASTTTALAVTTDALGLAALGMASLSLYWTITSSQSHTAKVGVNGTGVWAFGTF